MMAARETPTTGRIRWPALLALALFAASPVQSAGQDVAPRPSDLAITRLGAAERIRLHLAAGDTLEGRLSAVTGEILLLRDGRSIEVRQVAAAEALTRRTWPVAARGALLGTGIGLGLAVTSDSDDRLLAVELGLAAGLLGGAVIGAVIGSRRWDGDTVYVAPAVIAEARPTGLVDYRIGGTPGPIRTNVAVTPFVGSASYTYRARERNGTGRKFGLAQTQEIGAQLQYALGPRFVARLAAAAVRSSPRYSGTATGAGILSEIYWLTRGEAGIEFRMRSNVPGYFVAVVDGLHNPHGYVLAMDDSTLKPTGEDAGVMPRVGAGFGYDIFAAGDRRIRFEWIYRVGRYRHPDPGNVFEASRITRDRNVTIGVHWPLLRP